MMKEKSSEITQVVQALAIFFSLYFPYLMSEKLILLSSPALNSMLIIVSLLPILLYLFHYYEKMGIGVSILLYIAYSLLFGYDPYSFLIFMIIPVIILLKIIEHFQETKSPTINP